MKPTTRAELEKLEREFCEYGITVDVLSDMFDKLPYTMPDSEAVLLCKAYLFDKYRPEEMTPELKRLTKYFLPVKKRNNIKMT